MNESIYEIIEPAYQGAKSMIKRTDADGKEWFIPKDPSNSDYAAYLDSLNDNSEAE